MNANLQKYLKYKAKYLDLKNELEGGVIKPDIAKQIKIISEQIKKNKEKLIGYNSQMQKIKPEMEIYKKEINVLNDKLNTPKRGTTPQQRNDMFSQKTRLVNQYNPLKEQYDELLDNILKLDEEKAVYEEQRKELLSKPHAPPKSNYLSWKKVVKDIDENILDSKTRKSSVVDNNSLLQQIKENMDTIMNMQLDDDDDDNTRYLNSILETTTSFVVKLTSTMNEKNAEVYTESVQSYSTSEIEKNKINTGLQTLNLIMGELSKFRDAGKTVEYNELLSKHSDIPQIEKNFQKMKIYDSE